MGKLDGHTLEYWKNNCEEDYLHTPISVLKYINSLEERIEQLTIHYVVVPKGTLCECKKHSLKTNYGFEVCTKCGNEFDD